MPSDIPLPRQFFVLFIFRIRCTKTNSASSSSSVSYLSTIQTHILPSFPFSSPSTLYSCLSPPPFSPLPPPPFCAGQASAKIEPIPAYAYSGLSLRGNRGKEGRKGADPSCLLYSDFSISIYAHGGGGERGASSAGRKRGGRYLSVCLTERSLAWREAASPRNRCLFGLYRDTRICRNTFSKKKKS